MSIRFLFVGLSSLLACSESRGAGDVASGWFGVVAEHGTLSVAQSGDYEFRLQPTDERPTIKRSTGQLGSSLRDQLKALLTTELVNHYYENRTADEQRCRTEGYSLVHFGGCWIVDEVTDEITRDMLNVLVPLYKEKEAEALAARDTADNDASVPPMTTLGTPHI